MMRLFARVCEHFLSLSFCGGKLKLGQSGTSANVRITRARFVPGPTVDVVCFAPFAPSLALEWAAARGRLGRQSVKQERT